MAATDFVTETQVDSLVTNIANAVKANTTAIGTKTDDTAVTAHINDTSAAHAASAVSVADVGLLYTATQVEAALAEVMGVANAKTDDTVVTAHINDTTAAHAAASISYAGGTGITSTTVEAAIDELANEKLDKTGGTVTGAVAFSTQPTGITAASIAFVDTALDYTATNVEAALAEVMDVAQSAAGGGVVINDAATNTTNAWSSQKISDHVSTAVSALIDGAPGALDTLNELAAAINDDAAFSASVTTALANRLRFDAPQTLTGPQQAQGKTNLGVVSSTVNFAANFNTAIA